MLKSIFVGTLLLSTSSVLKKIIKEVSKASKYGENLWKHLGGAGCMSKYA